MIYWHTYSYKIVTDISKIFIDPSQDVLTHYQTTKF